MSSQGVLWGKKAGNYPGLYSVKGRLRACLIYVVSDTTNAQTILLTHMTLITFQYHIHELLQKQKRIAVIFLKRSY